MQHSANGLLTLHFPSGLPYLLICLAIFLFMPGINSQTIIRQSMDLTAYHEEAIKGFDENKVLIFPQSEAQYSNGVALISTKIPLPKNTEAKIIDFKPYFNSSKTLDIPYNSGIRSVIPSIKNMSGREGNMAQITFLPGQWISMNQFQILDSIAFTLSISENIQPRNNPPSFAAHSILQSIPTYKISTSEAGVYRIDNQLLTDLGISTSGIDPSKIHLYTTAPGPLPELVSSPRVDDLAETAIQIVGGDDGIWNAGDYILFYSPGPHRQYKEEDSTFTRQTNIYDDYKYFYIQINDQPGKRITNLTGSTDFILQSDEYDYYQRYEVDKVNLLKEYARIGAGQVWVDELITGTNRTVDLSNVFKIDNLVPDGIGYLKMAFAVRSKSKSTINMKADGQSSPISFGITYIEDSDSKVASYNSSKFSFVQKGGSLGISFDFPQVSTESLGWMDYAEVNVRRYLSKSSGLLHFRLNNPGVSGNIKYNLSKVSINDAVWDITDLFNIKQYSFNITGGNLSVTAPYPESRDFICFSYNDLKTPTKVGLVPSQDIHGMPTPAMVIVYHSKFADEAKQYAAYRSKTSGISVIALDVEQIKNEFSGGAQDPTGIRDMARMFYSRDPQTFKYILMFGDGSYDYRNLSFTAASKKENANYVPVYEYPRSVFDPIRSIPSDDYFGFLDDSDGEIENGLIDVYVGRFPIQDKSQAQSIINKIKTYETNKDTYGDWRNNLMLIADDWDNPNSDNFIVQSERLYGKIKEAYPGLNFAKIFLDIFKQESTLGGQSYPTAVQEMNDIFNNGVLIANYIGHGGVDGLAQERIIDRLTLNGMKNKYRLPLFITGTCSFATYDDPDITSVGKLCLTKPEAGMIGLMTTTRSVYISTNEVFINKLFTVIYSKPEGRYLTNGEILAMSKNITSGADRLSFVLFGDPSMTLAFPKENVVLETVNGQPVSQINPDTISSLELITLTGSVRNGNNEVISDFNGTVTATVFDKVFNLYARGNDGNGANYPVAFQNNILFKGKATVTNGKWNISFYTPKDINYAIDTGKLSFYAENGIYDAAGYNTKIKIGGESKDPVADNQSPVINLYLNDLDFKEGNSVNTTPVLIAKLSDDHGINISKSSIGHEIVTTLNQDVKTEKIMNDFYVADKDDYKKGEVRYQMDQLDPGEYTLKLRAWDIANNKSEAEVSFIVTNSEQNAISHLLNYPNPFTTATSFLFEFDSQSNTIDTEVSIYTVSGKLIKTIRESLSPNGKRFQTSSWDGRDQYGDQLAKGVYIYNVKVLQSLSNGNKVVTSDFQKLVLLK
ncbi:MAG: type IX secretion system sortase PorU [Saprospiraceae bacterium]|nr:type IX secretion system sortase PorU [Saprospiraceae bacterium]